MATVNEYFSKPNQEITITPEDVLEFKKCKADPIYFIENYVYIEHATKGEVLFKMYPYQVEIVESLNNNTRSIALCARQLGKTTVISAYLLWYAAFHKNKLCLVASNKNDNAMDVMAKIIFSYERLPEFLKPGVKSGTMHKIDFDNESTIKSQATTESTGRGKAVSLLMLDELAFVPKRIQEAMWKSILPTLSTGGKIIISSTPNGDSDLFSKLWFGSVMGKNDFKPISAVWSDHPDRTEENFKKGMVQELGELAFRQEHDCEFLSSDPLLINSMVLTSMQAKAPIEVDMGFQFWEDIVYHHTYVVGVDISTGVNGDFSTIQVVDLDTLDQVAEYRNNKVSTPQLYAAIKWIIKKIEDKRHLSKMNSNKEKGETYWSYENNGVGESITALYLNDEFFPEDGVLLNANEKKYGFATTGKNKIVSCMNLKQLVEKPVNGFVINSEILIAELKNFIAKGRSYEAKYGATDDLISAFLIVMQIIKKLSEYDETAFEAMYSYEQNDDIYDQDEYGGDPLPVL